MAERVYWDSCCFIDWIENKRQERLILLRQVVDAAINGHVLIVASTFAMAEVVRCNGDAPMSADEDQRIRNFFAAHKYIELRVLDREVANKCREIHRETLQNLG